MTAIPADIIEAAKASLGDMFPSMAHPNARYHRLGHAVSFRQDGLKLAGGTDQSHSSLIEFAGRVKRAASGRSAPSSLGVHLTVVFSDGAPPQMRGVHAGRIVARVEHAGIIGAQASSKLKRNVGREPYLTPTVTNNAVALPVRSRRPRPAIIRAVTADFCPKSIFQAHGETYRK